MKLRISLLGVLLGAAFMVQADVLPPEKLLPADTLGLITVPDWDKAMAAYEGFPPTLFWKDPAMKPFADKFNEKLKTELVAPLERELGIKLADYANLVHGQLTFAVTQNGWSGQTNQLPGFLLLIDAKDKGELLKTTLTDLKKKWIDGGKKIKTETIREIEFNTLIITAADLAKSFGNTFPGLKKDKDEPQGEPIELTIGQSGSLLMVGTAPKDFEKILVRQSGGLVPSLSEEPSFEANHTAMFREALMYGWVNYKPIGEIIKKMLSRADDNPSLGGANLPKPDKILQALGIDGLKTLAMNVTPADDGIMYNIFVGVPESSRRGLFKLLAPEAKEASPPPFVSADSTKFTRWRIDGQKVWATLEDLVKELSPQVSSLIKMGIDSAGKDKDPNFDLRKQLFGNLGDDLIIIEKAPRSLKAPDLNSPPKIFLIGSSNPEQLVGGLKVVISMLPPQMSNLKEREFLGRKIYSITMPAAPGPDGKLVESSLNFSYGNGYVAFTSDVPMLEEFLRSSEAKGKALSEIAGLREAAQRVGGMGTGWFGYENHTETFRATVEALKQDPQLFQKMFPSNPFEPATDSATKGFKDWFDYSLLPPFDRVAKYFHFSVFALSSTGEGIYLKTFSPTPPGLKK